MSNSCVWVVPRSHLWEKERADEWIFRGRKNFNLPDAVPAEVEPGDVLLHHVKVMHGSTVNHSQELRRVVYFDNRAVSWNRKYGWWTEEYMELRCKLFQCALHERRSRPYTEDDGTFEYTVPEGMPVWRPGDSIDLQAAREGRSLDMR